MTLEEVSLSVLMLTGAVSLTDWACPWVAKTSKRTSTQNSCSDFAHKGTGGESWAFHIWLFLQGTIVVLVLGFLVFFSAPSDSVHSVQVLEMEISNCWLHLEGAFVKIMWSVSSCASGKTSALAPAHCAAWFILKREEGRGQKEPAVEVFLLESDKQHRQRRIKGKYPPFSYWFWFWGQIWQSQLFGDHKFTGTCFVSVCDLGTCLF